MIHSICKGDLFSTNHGDCVVVEYKNAKNVLVRFLDGYERSCTVSNLLSGHVKNPYFPTVFDKGFIGESFDTNANILTSEQPYHIWRNMIRRCYDPKFQEKSSTYIGVTVCDDWLNYQNFKNWYFSRFEANGMDSNNNPFHIDKDYAKGKAVYSPETCILIPRELNQVIVSRRRYRGDLPIGVCKTANGRFYYQINIDNKRINSSLYNTPSEAFVGYKSAKEDQIKKLVCKYGDQLSDETKKIILSYEVEIDD